MRSSKRNASYMVHKDSKQPILNWDNSDVQRNMLDAVQFWLDKGVDGFFLANVEYMKRTIDGEQPDWDGIVALLEKVRERANQQRETSVNQSPVYAIVVDKRPN